MKKLLKPKRRSKPVFDKLKMRISILFLLSVFGMQANDSLAQKAKITFDQKDVSIFQLIDEIEHQSDFHFIYRIKNVDLNRKIDIKVDKQPLTEVLKTMFKGSATAYIIDEAEKQIHLNAKKPKTDSEKNKSEIIQFQVEGTVIDENGMPLPGASIIEKGSTNGVVSDFDGKFVIQVNDENAVLLVSFIGYETQEIQVAQQSNFDIQLKPESGALDEVVITALGMKREKKALGYAVGEVDSERLNLVPQENVLGGLSGKVSGLTINKSGNDVFAETYVTIRGRTSLTGNDQPLVVIDGAPVGDASVMGDISAMDIESISVLKGASAAALYGSRAGNGVILITTKSGAGYQKGIGVSLNSTLTLNSPYKYFDLQNRFTNGQRGLFNEATWQHWYGAEEGTTAVQYNSNGEALPLQFYDNSLEDYFTTGVTTINDATVSGNSEKGNFRLGISHLNAEGVTPEAELKRIGLNLGTNYNIIDNVKLSVNINLNNSNSDNYPSNLIGGNDEYFDIYNIAPHININDLRDNIWLENNVQQRNITEGYNNPWWFSSERQNRFDRIRGFGNLELNWEISSALNALARVSHSSVNNREEIVRPWSYQGFGDSQPNGSYYINRGLNRESNAEVLLSYTKEIKDFNLSASVGGNILNSKGESFNSGGDNLVLPGLFTLSNVSRGGLSYSSSFAEKAIYSAYGLMSLSFKDFAFVDLTARNDWSSTLPKENRSYFYPSISGSLLVSELAKMPTWISLVKLRSGWAEVGKDTSPYAIHPVLSQGYWGDDFTYSLPSSMPNTQLKPEIATSYEVGTDLKFFNNRLGLDATYYKNENRNQILNVNASPLSGYTSTTINAGKVENYGVELGLHLVPLKTEDLIWNMDFNFTTQKSKLVELTDGIDRISFGGGRDMGSFTRVGGEIGDLYSPYIEKVQGGPYAGWNLLDANGRWVVDRTQENQKKVGNFNSDFTLGMTTSISYKNFSLSASFDWRQGGQFFSESMKRMARSGKIEDWHNGVSSSTFSGILDANSFGGDREALANEIRSNPLYRDNDVWVGGRTEELGGFEYNGNNNGAFFPGVIDNGDGTYTENFGGPGTRMFDAYRVVESSGSFWRTGYAFMYDASFVKLRDITFTYTFPEKLAQKIAATNISLSVYSKNIILWTEAGIGIDPELAFYGGQQGHEKWNISPWTAPVGFRLNVGF